MRKYFVAAMVVAAVSGCSHESSEPSNTLHLQVEAKIKGLDPIYADDLYSGTEVQRVYEGLLQYHYLKRPYVLVPELAEAMPEISKDKKTYTFHIRKGIYFQDDPCFKSTNGKGRELTAEDFVYSFLRVADPKLVPQSSGWWTLDGKLVGLNEWRDSQAKAEKSDYAKPIEGLKALDDYTLQLKLVQPSYQFLYNLAQQFLVAVPHEAVEFYGAEFISHAIGTGPFKLAEFSPNKVVYDRNPSYHTEMYPSEGGPGDKEAGFLEDAGKQVPFVDRVVATIYEERQPMWLNFLAGKIDLTFPPKDSFEAAFDRKTKTLKPELAAKGIQVQVVPMLDTTHFSFNMEDPIVGKNKYLRQAMSLAYDAGKNLEETFYPGGIVQAQGPIPPGLTGYDPNYKNPYRQFNVEKARELMKKAGYPNGEGLAPIPYLVEGSGSLDRQFTEYDARQFAQIGVKVDLQFKSWPEFNAAVKNKKGQLWAMAWSADYPDAEDYLALLYSKNKSPGSNDANYSNAEYDRLYEKSLTLPDSPERTAIYQKMVKIAAEDCPWIPVAHRIRYFVNQKWVKNYKRHEFIDTGVAKYIRLDLTQKK